MQNKPIFLSIFVIVGISVIGINQSFGQTDVEIPSWVKGVANFWVEDKINDGEFAEALEFLIDSNIIQLGDTQVMSQNQIDWEEKYNTLLEEENTEDTKHKSQIDKMMQEHSNVYLEINQKNFDLEKENDIRIEKIISEWDNGKKEWQETYNKQQEKITELKTKIKELEK